MPGFSVDVNGDVSTWSLDNTNGGITNAGAIGGATSIDGTGDLTMGTITMPGFSVDDDGDTVTKSLDNTNGGITNAGAIGGATSIDGTGDLTMGTITMPGFSVDDDGDTVTKSLDNTNGGITNAGAIGGATSIDGTGDLTMGTITMPGFSVDDDGDTVTKSLDNTNGGITNAGAIGGATSIQVDNINIDGTTIGHIADTDLITLGAQSVTVATDATLSVTIVDIDGGAIDDTPIGANTPSTGAFTTITTVSAISVTSGGTGQTSYADGELLIGNGTTLTKATLTPSGATSITNACWCNHDKFYRYTTK